MRLRYILCIVLCCWQTFANAQEAQKNANYTTKDGLINNAVTGIYKDANGYFWISSYTYFQRWNGKHFFSNPIQTNIDSLKAKEPKKQFILFGEDEKSNRFLTDEASKLLTTKFSEKLTNTTPNNLQTQLELIAIKNFYKKKGSEHIYNFLDTKIRHAYQTGSGFVIESHDKELYYVDKKKCLLNIKHYLLDTSGYTCMAMGNCVVIYQKKIARYIVLVNDSIINTGYLKKEIPLKTRGITFIQKLDEFNCITFSDGVLRKFELQKNNSIIATDLLILKDYERYSCGYFDATNNALYLGTFTNGFTAYWLNNKIFRLITLPNPENYAYSHCIYNNKIINNIDFYLQYQTKESQSWNWGLTSAFCLLNNACYFYSNYTYIYTIKNQKCTTQKIAFSTRPLHHFVASDSIIYCSRQALDKYYVATNTYKSGNSSDWPTHNKQLYTIAKSTQPNIIYAVIEDALQALNMHTRTSTTLAKGITGEPRSIDVDTANNALFISTKYDGCYYHKNNQLTKLPLVFNNKAFSVHYVLQDKEGDYWLPSNDGLFFMFKKDFVDYLKDKKKVIHFKRFGKEDGILNDEFNGGFQNAGLLFRDSIYMGTMAGTIVFHPSIKYKQKKDEGKLILDYIKFDSTIIENNKTIELPPNFKQFEIKVDHPFVYNNEYLEYRLLGSNDTSWQSLNDNGLLNIKTLDAGVYKAEIRTTIDNDEIIKIPFTVKPYWYNTWWAYCLALLLLFTVIYIVFMWRWNLTKNKNLELINNSRTKFLATIVHDLRSPLNSYIGLADDIKYLIKKRDFNSIDELGNAMDEKSRNLTLLVSNVLNWSNAEQGLNKINLQPIVLNDVLNEILPAYLDIADFRKINIEVNVPEKTTFKCDKNALSLIIRNLVDNALKHSDNDTTISIEYYANNAKNIIEISNKFNHKQTLALSEINNVFKGFAKAEPHTNNLGLGIASIYNSCLILEASMELNWDKDVVRFKLILPA